MIIIFSTHEDQSTQKVADWLLHYQQQPVIINELNPIIDIFIDIKPKGEDTVFFTLQSGQTIAEKDIKVVWYRRGLYYLKFPYNSLQRKPRYRALYQHLKAEYDALTQFLFFRLQNKTIGDYNQSSPNKLFVLEMARKAGLTIPSTRIISNKKNRFKQPHISKNITEVLNLPYKGKLLYNRTTMQATYKEAHFFPSLIQCNIKKYGELRVFFFLDTFFTMAILPITGNQLKTDNRDITATEYLHRVAFSLPLAIEKKLTKLIQTLGYTTCSIDMIVDDRFNYHFLELNPVGQFDNLATLCHLDIDQFIAKKLIEYEKRNTTKGNKIIRTGSTLNLSSP
jgi:hypothetical protein